MYKVINVISDSNIGGAGKCILNFLKYYDENKFEVITVIPKNSLLKAEIEKLKKPYYEIDGLTDKSLDFKVINSLKRYFKEQKPDIIHCHAAMSARIAGKLTKKAKVIYTRHSVFEPSKTISRGLGKIINGAVNNFFADKIIAVAEAAKDNLVKTGVSSKKIIVVKNGVEPLEKIPVKRDDDSFVLGIAARLTEVKGHIYILRALKKLICDGYNVTLKIAGTGPFEKEIKDEIDRLKINDNVKMLGFVTDVKSFNNSIDLNVNASFGTEATSLSLLEGMSLGIPAVVSDFGGNPGVIYDGKNGFLFKTKDSDDMYEKLKKVIYDKELYEKMQKSCIEIFNSEFTAEIMTKNIENVYADVLKVR